MGDPVDGALRKTRRKGRAHSELPQYTTLSVYKERRVVPETDVPESLTDCPLTTGEGIWDLEETGLHSVFEADVVAVRTTR